MDADSLSRRERQVLDVLYTKSEATARGVAEALREPQSLDAVRMTLGILEKKGIITHRRDGRRHVYRPTRPADHARRSAWSRMTRTFFSGSPSKAILSLLDMSGDKLDDDELDQLSAWVKQQARARKKRSNR